MIQNEIQIILHTVIVHILICLIWSEDNFFVAEVNGLNYYHIITGQYDEIKFDHTVHL